MSSCATWNDDTLSAQEIMKDQTEVPGELNENETTIVKLALTKENQESYESDETSRTEALRNPLILHRIFSNLPTKSLLASCSLVNKSWNTQARKFVRDYRICQIFNGGWKSSSEYLPEHGMLAPANRSLKRGCEFVQQVDNLCFEIEKSDRIVAYNRFEVFIEPCRWNGGLSSGVSTELEMKSQLKLKYLKIVWGHRHPDADCDDHKALKALLLQTSSGVHKLELWGLSPIFEQYFRDCFPKFSKLEEIVFVGGSVHCRHQDLRKNTLRRIMDGAPKLKKIEAKGYRTVQCIPEQYYGLLEVMEFNYSIIQEFKMDQDCLPRLLAARPQLRVLNILDVSRNIQRQHSLQYDHFLQKLLRNCPQSLETITFFGLCPLGKLSFPPLVNLTKLIITSQFAVYEGYWTMLSSIDFERLTPRLAELQVQILSTSTSTRAYEDVLLWPDPNENWNRNGTVPRCCSLRKLKLRVEADRLNLSLLKCVFPNVASLTLKMDNSQALDDRDIMQLSEICEMWPELEDLEITGDCNYLERCHDADFCGIDVQEAAWLALMNHDFLEHVHIVPIKPSVLTMLKLRRLRIDFKFDDHSSDDPDDYVDYYEEDFTTNVTRLVALRTIPDASVSAIFTPGGAAPR